jgi:predicted nucleotidyltransferase
MASPGTDYTPYLDHARRQERVRLRDTKLRRQRAWAVAAEIADFLRREYRPSRVIAFGSLVHPEAFGAQSDIDIAVDGIPWPEYLRAWNDVEARFREFKVDLLDLGAVSTRMRGRIEEEGRDL